MFCRRALQRVGPLARRAFPAGARHAPGRHMSFGVPSSSSNMAFVVLGGGGLTAAVAYKTVRGDSEPHEDRLASMAPAEKAPEVAAPAAEAAPVVVVEQGPLSTELVGVHPTEALPIPRGA
ncbi:hypothetical protein EYF80_043335 [Liparis tanakae]|uniref:Uncharacterized protein n=1 Tax=Liparis tanakae TaxID=230148 RepID=A0A4Z2FZ38_9TELE|nr:hypothetical protein EYF80_043335 [Liparis tanakae]